MQTFFNKAIQAVYIRIELQPAQEKVIGAGALAKILNALETSFVNLAEAEIQNRYSEQTSALKKETKLFLAATKLWMTDFDFARMTFALAPDLSPANYPFKTLTNFMALKEACFALFADTVFTDAFFSSDTVEKMAERYSAKQRINIFKPIYDELINQENFTVYFGDSPTSTSKKWLKTDDQELLTKLMLEAVKKAKEAIETYYQLVKTGEENDLFGKRSTYKKVLVTETARQDVYPYQVKKVKVDQKVVFLSRQLSAEVRVKDGFYQISLPELQISVTEKQRADAEKAFDTSLAQLINQYNKGNWNSSDQKSKTVLLKLKELLAEH
ncbi:hypothetical protein [uncultured Mucilaginibacter sp.]|uniref:hypothetical protein n=1 Tax=uncultured Mucilaginibacter sp. TaxID=797541 RepID=UPI00260621D7|nr:hypothetical protein [uncultured Mucilaginibacter sp.]